MVLDLGRDTNIGIPDAEIQQVNVVLSQPITEALKEQVADKLEETNLRLAASHRVHELGWDVEVPLGVDD